jgi:hypothetical protein
MVKHLLWDCPFSRSCWEEVQSEQAEYSSRKSTLVCSVAG